jgi:hypothetical protein
LLSIYCAPPFSCPLGKGTPFTTHSDKTTLYYQYIIINCSFNLTIHFSFKFTKRGCAPIRDRIAWFETNEAYSEEDDVDAARIELLHLLPADRCAMPCEMYAQAE